MNTATILLNIDLAAGTAAQRGPPPSAGSRAACVHDLIRPAVLRAWQAFPVAMRSQLNPPAPLGLILIVRLS
jgi:hypothetical protein